LITGNIGAIAPAASASIAKTATAITSTETLAKSPGITGLIVIGTIAETSPCFGAATCGACSIATWHFSHSFLNIKLI
jgi:uncharacterized membrane-anchored protein